jgi:hypothetical protein
VRLRNPGEEIAQAIVHGIEAPADNPDRCTYRAHCSLPHGARISHFRMGARECNLTVG